jgi:rhodanese-related sulfurtransferase
MRQIIFTFLFCCTSLFAEVENIPATKAFLDRNLTIIDIRTPGEWQQTGIVEGSHPIMFFDERGQYDVDAFIAKLRQLVKPNEPFALICRTGSRTSTLAPFLSKEFGYHVINLKGGILQLIREGYQPVPYLPKR